MIVKGRELVRFVSTLSQFLLFSSSSLPYSFYSFPLFLSFSSFFPVYYTYIYSRPQKFSHEIDKGAIFKLKKKKKKHGAIFSIWNLGRSTWNVFFTRTNFCETIFAFELVRALWARWRTIRSHQRDQADQRDSIVGHPFETAVCLASHCHDDGELVGIFMDGDRRVSTRLNKGITVTQMWG